MHPYVHHVAPDQSVLASACVDDGSVLPSGFVDDGPHCVSAFDVFLCGADQALIASEEYGDDGESHGIGLDAAVDRLAVGVGGVARAAGPDLPIVLDFSRVSKNAKEASNNNRTIKRQAAHIKGLKDENKRLKCELVLNTITGTDAAGKHLDARCGLQLAMWRNKAHASCRAMAVIAEGKCHESTIRRWEVKTGTSVCAVMGCFHNGCEQFIADGQRGDPFSPWRCSVTLLSGDATKTCHRGDKVQALRVVSKYVLDDDASTVLRHECWPDMQKCKSGSAEDCYNIVKKQCRIVSCAALDPEVFSPYEFERVVRFVNIVGDNGSDQISFRSSVAAMYIGVLHVLVYIFSCLTHQQSLGSCRVLGFTDVLSKKWGLPKPYYGGLVKTINLFRQWPEPGISKPSTCYAGRWGAVSGAEKWIKAHGEGKMRVRFTN